MRGIDDEPGALQAMLLLHTRGHLVGYGAWQADEIGCYDHHAAMRPAFDGQSLRFQVVEDALGGMSAIGVAAQVNRPLGRDHLSGDTRFVIGGVQCARGEENGAELKERGSRVHQT
jgi:hypothetical protein